MIIKTNFNTGYKNSEFKPEVNNQKSCMDPRKSSSYQLSASNSRGN